MSVTPDSQLSGSGHDLEAGADASAYNFDESVVIPDEMIASSFIDELGINVSALQQEDSSSAQEEFDRRRRLRASTPATTDAGQSSRSPLARSVGAPVGRPDSPTMPVQQQTPSGSSKETASITNNDWNSRYQDVMKSYLEFQDTGDMDIEQSTTLRRLMHLAFDFIEVAKVYGRIIISERYLEHKTIKPTSLGGVAGGDKFVVGNILFKFAIDSHGLFKTDWAASKVAGAELRGCMAFSSCKVAQVRLPLMALVDYMGHRLIAMSLLPINSSTLVYGTSDACQHVHSDPEVAGWMKMFADKMNLQPHWCGTGAQRKYLFTACDIEGHRGTDNNLYLVDFSRAFPPTAPDKRIPNGHIFQLFRREWVLNYPQRLCPDACSRFVEEDPKKSEYLKLIKQATRDLLATAPKFLSDTLHPIIGERNQNEPLDKVDITQHIHQAGFNLRFIGILLRHSQDYHTISNLLLIEALARVLKNELRAQLTELIRSIQMVLMTPYHQLVITFLNTIFGNLASAAPLYEKVVRELEQKFYVNNLPQLLNGVLSQVAGRARLTDAPPGLDFESSTPAQLHSFVVTGTVENMRVLYLLLRRLCGLASIRMTKSCLQNSQRGSYWNANAPFDIIDLKSIDVRVKHTNIAYSAEASFLYVKALEALQRRSSEEAIVLLGKAKKRFLTALRSDPTNPDLLRGISLVHYKLTEYHQLSGKNMANVSFRLTDPLAIETNAFFLRALEAKRDDPNTLHHYARFLLRCNRFKTAEQSFLRGLQLDPNNVRILRSYGFFLSEMGDFELAERFFSRANTIMKIYNAEQKR